MVDNLDIETMAARLRPFFVEVIDAKGGGPKAVTRRLAELGYEVKERTVASWREGRYFPSATVAGLLSTVYGVSLDRYLLGEALEQTLAQRIQALEGRLERVEGRLQGWEIEWASAAGQEPPADLSGGAIDLGAVRTQRQVADLAREVQELREALRQQQA